jgi:hypothetical protein
MEWHDIEKKKITDLRDMAKKYEDVGAVSGLSKEDLIVIVAKHLGISKPHLLVEGVDKAAIKVEIKGLKVLRNAALEAHDSKELKKVRRRIHKKKRALRHAARLH